MLYRFVETELIFKELNQRISGMLFAIPFGEDANLSMRAAKGLDNLAAVPIGTELHNDPAIFDPGLHKPSFAFSSRRSIGSANMVL